MKKILLNERIGKHFLPGDSIKQAGQLTMWARGIRRSLSHLSLERWVPLPEAFAEQVFSGGIFSEDIDSFKGIRRGQGELCQAHKLLSRPISIPSASLNQLQGRLMGSKCRALLIFFLLLLLLDQLFISGYQGKFIALGSLVPHLLSELTIMVTAELVSVRYRSLPKCCPPLNKTGAGV